MVGINDFGETAYLYKFKQITIQADKVNEFGLPHRMMHTTNTY